MGLLISEAYLFADPGQIAVFAGNPLIWIRNTRVPE
jgi:hypothetical protein